MIFILFFKKDREATIDMKNTRDLLVTGDMQHSVHGWLVGWLFATDLEDKVTICCNTTEVWHGNVMHNLIFCKQSESFWRCSGGHQICTVSGFIIQQKAHFCFSCIPYRMCFLMSDITAKCNQKTIKRNFAVQKRNMWNSTWSEV